MTEPEGRAGHKSIAVEGKRDGFRGAPTSYNVFMKYVSYEKSKSCPDVSLIFSRKCYEEWLSTRPSKKLKFPANSYQRVLYAHLRGADKRRAFPEEVEKELLKLIRDYRNNPWKEMFKEEKVKFGKRCFTKKGYHERRNDPEDTSNIYAPPETQTNVLKRRKSSLISMENKMIQLPIIPIPIVDKLLPWEVLLSILHCHVPVEEQSSSRKAAQQRGLTFWSPAIVFFMNELVNSNDNRFSHSFQFPSSEEQIFRKDRPMSKILVSESVIVRENEHTRSLFNGSVVGKHWYEIYGSLLSVYFAHIHFLPTLSKIGYCWRRELLQKCDGTKMVCLFKVRRFNGGYELDLQDQSERYPHILERMHFI